MTNLPTKFEVSIFTRYENMKGAGLRNLPEQSASVSSDETDALTMTKLSDTDLLLQTRVRQNHHLPYKLTVVASSRNNNIVN